MEILFISHGKIVLSSSIIKALNEEHITISLCKDISSHKDNIKIRLLKENDININKRHRR